jgi:broad specificity phosphatase PhoE
VTGATLYIIRHGETAWSLTGQHTGVTDLPLTPHGEAQARGLASPLRDIDFSQVLTSPLLRARQTCDLAGLGADALIEPDLGEWNYGAYEGCRSVDIRRERPDWSIYRDGCPGGETPDAVAARADRLIERLAQPGSCIALFSHGQFACSLAARWIGLDIGQAEHLEIDPASIGKLSHSHSRPEIRVIAMWNASPEDRFDHGK